MYLVVGLTSEILGFDFANQGIEEIHKTGEYGDMNTCDTVVVVLVLVVVLIVVCTS